MPQRTEHRFTAMGGPCLLLVEDVGYQVDSSLIDAVVAEVERLEARYSRYREDSLVSRINHAAGSGQATPIDPETAALCDYIDTLHAESDGRFDPTSGVLRKAWHFETATLPDPEKVKRLLPLIGWPQVQRNSRGLTLPRRDMELDFGGVVKEYTVDSILALLLRAGVKHALFDMAGDLGVIGTRANGEPWSVGIRHPRGGDPITHLAMSESCLASSGDYERGMTVRGRRYSHLLDPTTGAPVEGLLCASVSAPQCMVAGSTATTALLFPEAEGLAWLASVGLPWIAVDRQLQVHGPLAANSALT